MHVNYTYKEFKRNITGFTFKSVKTVQISWQRVDLGHQPAK